MSQVNTISGNITSVFRIEALDRNILIGSATINLYALIVGVLLMVLAGLVIVGGIKRIAQFTEKFVPFMACAYILGALIVFIVNIGKVGEVFGAIFSFAFGFGSRRRSGRAGSQKRDDMGSQTRRILKRSRTWVLGDGALCVQRGRACAAGNVGHL